MANITFTDKSFLENFLGMNSGYVLDFSDKTFKIFFKESVDIDIDTPKYLAKGTSKANRMRCFLALESNSLVAKLLKQLLEMKKHGTGDDYRDYNAIIEKLTKNNEINFDFIGIANNEEENHIQECIDAIINEVNNNKPEHALDRLHTLAAGVINHLSKKRNKDTSLQSSYGAYIKTLDIDEETRKILKGQINTLEQLNVIRNNRSLAHPNPLLRDRDAALYIIKIIHASIAFLIKKAIDVAKQ